MDRAALVALYDATGGANWTINTNWSTTAALSEWYGVTTDVDGRVTELDLADNNLSGEIPAKLGELTSLQFLYLNQNMLSGEIPVELGSLTGLRILYLWGNELSGAIPVKLGSLTSLQQLYLGGNKLSGAIPVELGGLTSLQELSLAQNMLRGEIPVELGNLTSLRRLYLWGNELSGAIPVELRKLTSLQELSLRNNELRGEIPAELGDLTNLRILNLRDNELRGATPVELGDLTNLQELKLSGNTDLTGTIPLGLMNLDDLMTVWIQATGLCAPEDAAFRAWAAAINDFRGCGGPPPPRPPPPPGGGGGGGSGGTSQTAPDAPTNLMADATDGAVTLTWEAPARDGGSEITDYEYRINRRNPWISIGSTDTNHTVTGLVNGTEYVFEVRAVNRIGKSFSSNRAEATPEAPEVFALDFAHFANGTSITSDLVLVNVAPQPARPAIYFYDTEGAPIAAESVMDITGDLEITEDGALTVQTEMEPLGVLTISTHGRGELVSGSARVVSEGPIGGMLRFEHPALGVAGVEASPPLSDALFPGEPPGGRNQHGGCDPQPGRGSDGSALRIDARRCAARLREYLSGGKRANVLAHRPGVPRRRYVRLHGVGALRCGWAGAIQRRGPGNGPRQPHLRHASGGAGPREDGSGIDARQCPCFV